MAFPTLPTSIDEMQDRSWAAFEPGFKELLQRPIDKNNYRQWLHDWSDLQRVVSEVWTTTYIDTSLNTKDAQKEAAYKTFVTDVFPEITRADQALKEKLLAVDPQDDDLRLIMRQMRNEAELFREENIPLQTELQQLDNEYDKITGGLKVEWEGEEKNLAQILPYLEGKDRAVREKAWRAYMGEWQTVREELNKLFMKMLALRRQMAKNAGFDNFRDYQFRAMNRFDYAPADCEVFHQAIEKVVVPAAQEILADLQAFLTAEALHPWDWIPEKGLMVEGSDYPPLKPYASEDELVNRGINIFNQVDPELGRYFVDMAESDLLDLETRSGKAMGGYCAPLMLRRKTFIFMNGVGNHDTVQTLLHEAGHAFHAYEAQQPLIWQEEVPMEFCEVASMAMELLAVPFLTRDQGGFYNKAEAARAVLAHLQKTILFLPYMAAVDGFQHWVYTVKGELTPADLDGKWLELEQRFLSGVDWRGLEEERMSGWHRKLHIFQNPFYYVEYGMASIGALQVWRNSKRSSQQEALSAYRYGLSLGGTRTLPQLFEAAGAEFRFDPEFLSDLLAFVGEQIQDLKQTIVSSMN